MDEDKGLSFCEDLLPWPPNLPEKGRKTEKKIRPPFGGLKGG
mgnify:FL=1